MFLRIFSAGLLAATLISCGGETATPEPEGDSVDCAIGPGSDFSNVCTLEVTAPGAFVIHHPDGGFRRFVLSEDEAATLSVADGAEPIVSETFDEGTQIIEFDLEVDRYRLDMGLVTPASDE